MKRTALTLTLALFFGLIATAWSQVPAQRVIIVDPTGMHAAGVTGGALGTSASVSVDAISHISSVTHVAGTGTFDVNCVTGCSASAGVTGSTHVSVALHVAGTINGAQFHVQGLGIPGQAHGGVLTIQGVAGGVAVPISGSLSVTTDNVNVFHQSTIRHISSVTHVAITSFSREAHLAAAQSGTWTVAAAHQGGNWNVAHIGGAVHVAGISNVGSGTTAATNPMVCHTTVAFSTTADIVLAHSQNSMRIFICSVVVVAAGAEGVSIVEGTGTVCATGLRGVIGGFGGTMALAANGGFSSISPFPWVSSAVAGNQVCLDKSGSGNVSGTITYRGAP